MTSELMRATVAEPQGDAREGGAERSGRQTRDHRQANRQRGRQWATSVLANTKSNPHQDTASRAGWHAGKVQVLTRGDLPRESAGEVSRGRSSKDRSRGLEDARLNYETGTLRPAKGRRSQQQRSMAHCAIGQDTPRRQQNTVGNHDTLREPSPAGRCSRRNRGGERNSEMHA
jgi:hypothetical protein